MSSLRFLTFVCISALFLSCAATEIDEPYGPDAPETSTLPQPFFQYGEINLAHTATLPNHNADKSIHYHYAVNNLPAAHDETFTYETLLTFASLFTRNPSALSAEVSLTIHIATPTDPTDYLAHTRPLTYKQSVTITNIRSGQTFSVQPYNLTLTKGDIIVLSVPNDSILLHVGPNNVGQFVQYGVVSLPSNDDSAADAATATTIVSQTPIETSYVLSDNTGVAPGNYNQLCASYGTIGRKTVDMIDSNLYTFSSETLIREDGAIDSFKLALCKNRDGVCDPLPNSKSAKVDILIARPLSLEFDIISLEGFVVQRSLTQTFTGVKNLKDYLIDEPIRVRKGDLIGFRIRTANVYGAWYSPAADADAAAATTAPPTEPSPRVPPSREVAIPARSTRAEHSLRVSTPSGPRIYFVAAILYALGLPIVLPFIDQPNVPRFTFNVIQDDVVLPPGGNAPTGGDPQIGGFQGQSYQFHGLADEIFNLISTPTMQLNSHFVYLSSGKCDYNNTVCFQHPGTYLDVLGFTIPSQQDDVHIKFVAGSHEKGLRVWMGHGDAEMTEIEVGKYRHGLKWVMGNDTTQIASVKYNRFGEAEISTPLIHIKVINSDYFFNLEVALLDRELLRIGSTKHTITDHNICHHDKNGHAQVNEAGEQLHAQHDHGIVEAQLMKKYHTDYPIHGLIGQTWRNVLVCGKHWMGGVNDYVVSSLFGSDYFYNFYKSQ